MYDPRIARWMSLDPLARKAPEWSPYRFGFDNPILFKDEDGRFEVTPEFAKKYPKTAILLMNADKLYYIVPKNWTGS